jgi:hypothetical protein
MSRARNPPEYPGRRARTRVRPTNRAQIRVRSQWRLANPRPEKSGCVPRAKRGRTHHRSAIKQTRSIAASKKVGPPARCSARPHGLSRVSDEWGHPRQVSESASSHGGCSPYTGAALRFAFASALPARAVANGALGSGYCGESGIRTRRTMDNSRIYRHFCGLASDTRRTNSS